jgi:hypothetical protein
MGAFRRGPTSPPIADSPGPADSVRLAAKLDHTPQNCDPVRLRQACEHGVPQTLMSAAYTDLAQPSPDTRASRLLVVSGGGFPEAFWGCLFGSDGLPAGWKCGLCGFATIHAASLAPLTAL